MTSSSLLPVSNRYVCKSCDTIGDHWIMYCPKSKLKRDTLQIIISIAWEYPPREEPIIMDVKPSDTIQDIKHKINDQEGVQLTKVFVKGKRFLMDKRTLSSYDITNGTVFILSGWYYQMYVMSHYIQYHQYLNLYIHSFVGSGRAIDVAPTDTIESIKLRILDFEKWHSRSPRTFRIRFGGKTLENHRTLQDYNIQRESTIRY